MRVPYCLVLIIVMAKDNFRFCTEVRIWTTVLKSSIYVTK